jgi:TolA-binding protein
MILGLSALQAVDGDELLFREGSARFERGDYSGAAERYRDLLRRYPGSDLSPEALYRLGIARVKTGEYREGVDLLERLEARYPAGRFRSSFWIGFGYEKMSRFEESISALNRYIDGDDSLYRREALVLSAYVSAGLGDDRGAEEHLLELTGLDRGFFVERGGLVLLAESYRKAQRFGEILELGREYGDYSGGRLPQRFRLSLGEAYQALGRDGEAEPQYRLVLEAGDAEERAAAYGRLFLLYESSQRLADMEALILDAEKGLAGDRQALARFWFRAGAVLAAGERPARGIGYLKRAWDARSSAELPGTLPLFYAQALLDSGDVQGAADILRTALEEEYGDIGRLKYRLAAAESRLGRWDVVAELLGPAGGRLDAPAALLFCRACLKLERYEEGLTVAAAALDSQPATRWQTELLDVTWRLQAAAGEPAAAVKSYARLRRLSADGQGPDLLYSRLLFNAGLYDQVLKSLDGESSDPVAGMLTGLSLIGTEEYAASHAALSAVQASGLDGGLRALRSYYLAWSSYRMGNYSEALKGFAAFRRDFPEHSYAADAAFYGGWSAFTLKEYLRAAELFAEYGEGSRAPEALMARARALAAAGRDGEAILLAERYTGKYGGQQAAEAVFLIFQIRLDAGDLNGSARTLERLGREFPESRWVSRALYRQGRGELTAEKYSEAAERFDVYRQRYPAGEYAAESLFYRAEVAVRTGEIRLALLLWERLVREYPDSSLRPSALSMRGARLVEMGDYVQALDVYSMLLAEYPVQAARLGTSAEIKRLESLLVSAGSQYQRLVDEADAAGGVSTQKGREILVRAVQSAFAEGRAEDFSAAGRVVRRLLDASIGDDREKAGIFFLAGEYSFRRNEYADAAGRYLAAATIMTGNPDFTAEALYRAAQMYLYAGDRRGYREVLTRLRQAFAGSPWLETAENLSGEVR